MTVTVLPSRHRDTHLLEHHNPSPGVENFHAHRHRDPTTTYLVAWRRRVPVGRAEIRWHGCPADHVRARHPHCPEINGLEVFPADLRGNGIGTTLITAAETEATARGLRHIGLGVARDNPDAHRLYQRLGYRGDTTYTDEYTLLDSLGTRHHITLACLFLTKTLPRRISRRPATALLTRVKAALTGTRPAGSRQI